MPLTQREWDIAQLQAEVKVQRLFDEWRRNFMKGREVTPNADTSAGPALPSAQPQPNDIQQAQPY